MIDKDQLLADYDGKFMGGMSLARKSAIRQFLDWLADQQFKLIETCPKDGTLFDAFWIDENGTITRREIDCHFERGAVMRKHGYPAFWTVYDPQPTHWAPRPVISC